MRIFATFLGIFLQKACLLVFWPSCSVAWNACHICMFVCMYLFIYVCKYVCLFCLLLFFFPFVCLIILFVCI